MQWIMVIIIRLLVPLSILRFPVWGSIAAIAADNLDVVILDALGIKDYSLYNSIDKALDIYFYLIQGYTVLFWENIKAKKVGLGLLVYRLVGTVIYEITQMRFVLLVFPNVFIFFYMFYVLYKSIFKKDPYKSVSSMLIILTVLTVIKIGQEYMLHVAQYPIYNLLKSIFFPFI